MIMILNIIIKVIMLRRPGLQPDVAGLGGPRPQPDGRDRRGGRRGRGGRRDDGPHAGVGQGQMGSALMASLQISCFLTGTFWVLSTQSVKNHYFCSGPISVDPHSSATKGDAVHPDAGPPLHGRQLHPLRRERPGLPHPLRLKAVQINSNGYYQ